MKNDEPLAKKREVFSLLFVIFSGILGAILLTVALTLYYTSEKTYPATSVLVQPNVLAAVRYVESHGKDKSTYQFDKILYSFTKDNQYRTVDVSPEKYATIFTMLSKDTSLREPPAEAESRILGGPKMIILLKNPVHQAYHTFLTVEFSADGDGYRAEMLGSESQKQWAYFSHPHAVEKIQQILLHE